MSVTDSHLYGLDRPFPDGQPPNNTTIVQPYLRNPHIDIANCIALALQFVKCTNNITDPTLSDDAWGCYISTNGTFQSSMVRDPKYRGRPIITCEFTGQRTSRTGIGGIMGQFSSTQMSDPAPLPDTAPVEIIPGTVATTKGKFKRSTVEVKIFATNSLLRDTFGSLVGSLMDNTLEDAMVEDIGYEYVMEMSGANGTNIAQPEAGDPFFLYERTYTYECMWNSLIVGRDVLVQVVQQTFTDSFDPDDSSSITTRVNDNSPPP